MFESIIGKTIFDDIRNIELLGILLAHCIHQRWIIGSPVVIRPIGMQYWCCYIWRWRHHHPIQSNYKDIKADLSQIKEIRKNIVICTNLMAYTISVFCIQHQNKSYLLDMYNVEVFRSTGPQHCSDWLSQWRWGMRWCLKNITYQIYKSYSSNNSVLFLWLLISLLPKP